VPASANLRRCGLLQRTKYENFHRALEVWGPWQPVKSTWDAAYEPEMTKPYAWQALAPDILFSSRGRAFRADGQTFVISVGVPITTVKKWLHRTQAAHEISPITVLSFQWYRPRIWAGGLRLESLLFTDAHPPSENAKGKIMYQIASVRVFVADIEHSAPRLPKLTKRKLLQIGVASAFATGVLAAGPPAQARITQIQILTKPKTIAFGGYSFPGVGQYEVITGIATGEVNPKNLQNSVITDLAKAAPKELARCFVDLGSSRLCRCCTAATALRSTRR
jgi:hypothetical protein